MNSIFKKIENVEQSQFTMPLSLRLIKECADAGITNWNKLHIADLLSLVYSIRIENAKKYLNYIRQEKLQKKGISVISKATQKDFENL